MSLAPFDTSRLPAGVRARHVANGNGLSMHVLEAGEASDGTRTVILLHGFPELAYSWRKVLPALAEAGYHAVAPDLRGYGRTVGGSTGYDIDLAEYRILNLVRDVTGLVGGLGLRSVRAVIGHDFGSPLAAASALVRPDVFRSVVMMSAPFAGVPRWPKAGGAAGQISAMTGLADPGLDVALGRLDPPRKHYQWFYSTPGANADMHGAPQGVHAFLRAYYHMKSADWPANRPYHLGTWSADALAQLPTYYVMAADKGMAETVAPEMPSREAISACRWLTEDELSVYASEYERTGFQGGLNWYRCVTSGLFAQDLKTFQGRTIDVPAAFIAGASDWGIHQKPGDLEAMEARQCSRFEGTHLIEGAGHWVQQEQAEAVGRLLLDFLARRD